MQLSLQELSQIIKQSATLSERLDLEYIPSEVNENDPIIHSRLETWCKIVTEGDWEKFEQRLAWDNLDLYKVKKVIGSVSAIKNIPIPTWAKILNECLETASLINLEELRQRAFSSQLLDPKTPLIFEELFLPFIEVARNKLINHTESYYCLLSPNAHACLERSLLRSLSQACSVPLEIEFSLFRITKQTSLIRLLNTSNGKSSRKHYQSFIGSLLAEGLKKFFLEYPVLARLVSTLIEMWVDTYNEFLTRLASDWNEISKVFRVETDLERVISVKPNLSDRHCGGRSVMEITFASGLKIVYKPRDLGIELAYVKFLAWLNENGIPLPFKLYRVFNRSGYGWTEFINTCHPTNTEENKRYHQRFGMLLCIVYVLDSTDLHYENIIPCGEYPVLIDLETLMHPRVRELEESENPQKPEFVAYQKFTHSVVRSGLLPRWQFDSSSGEVYDISGLLGHNQTYVSSEHKKWENVNNDKMRFGYTKTKNITELDSLLTDSSVKFTVESYCNDIINGFQEMYQFFIDNQQKLLSLDSPLATLFKQKIRFVFRDTQTYISVLRKIMEPQFLHDGIDQSIQLDILSRQLIISPTKPVFLPLLEIEKKALQNMEVPHFDARADSDIFDISFDKNQSIDGFFMEPSCNRVIEKLKNLNEDDLHQQVSFIRYSLYSRITGDVHECRQSKHFDLNFIIDDVVPLTKLQLVRQAVKVGLELKKQSIHCPEDIVTWICPQYVTQKQCFQFKNIGNSLYDGSHGIALFLASLSKITSDNRFCDLSLGSLKSFHQELRNVTNVNLIKIFKEVGIGGVEGAGSIIYVLACIYQILEKSVFLNDARKVALSITPELIAADTKFDICAGAAGTILGLLALYRLSPEQAILDLAIICGNHLLNNRVASQSGYKTWATAKGRLLTGFSHGASGITYALVNLYKVTNETAFLEAAEEGIAYERSVFSHEMSNWPDFREPYSYEKPSFACSWCHGAPGIGLARLGILGVLDSPAIHEDIEAAIIATKQQKLRNSDHLCCGNLGRVDFLLTAAQKLSRPELMQDAIQIASRVVARAKQKGHFGYSSILNFHPGFFPGAAGIGYQLLRLAYPDQLPSVLLWE